MGTDKTARQDAVIRALAETGGRIAQALHLAGVNGSTHRNWTSDPAYKLRVEEAKRVNKSRARAAAEIETVFDPYAPQRRPPTLTEGRMLYIGRPVLPHQQPIFRAWEDRTNLSVIVLGPPGSGKDTTAGDIVLLEAAFDRNKRVAWIMESAEFSIRRLGERISPYLVDKRIYDLTPPGPGCRKPTRSLIEDFGPFAWRTGMRYPGGDRIPAPTWTKHSMYFLGRDSEADPNLWATGIGGALYGSRIDTAVTSDIFTPENQGSPVVRADQMGWLFGTFFSRLDEGGRFLHLGTRVGPNDNNVELLRRLIGEAEIVEQDGYYTKYANGVAVVVFPAIQMDDEGNEISYWPERFPLDSKLILPDGTEFLADELSMARQKVLAKEGAHRIRGLREIRTRDPAMFETVYQQNPPSSEAGEFTPELLDFCDDPERTMGVSLPGRPLILGVDPARTGGAAWVLWEWDQDRRVATVVDLFYGEKLGLGGIRERLLVDPITRFWPRYTAYEYNHDASVLEHPEVISAVNATRTELVRHFTASNRIEGEVRVAAMSFDMREGRIRFPAAKPQDRLRMGLLKQHALNWDARSVAAGRPAAHRSAPDDLWMAAWVGWVTIRQRLDREIRPATVEAGQVPSITRRRWITRARQPMRESVKPESDLLSYFDH